MAQCDFYRTLLVKAIAKAHPRGGDMDFASEWESGMVLEAYVEWERLL